MQQNKDIPIYNSNDIEEFWQKRWSETGLYQTDLYKASKPYFNLMMYPYPSAEGLHVGNVYAFVGSDIHGRYKKMQGFDVFEPIGFDSGGIHSENFAIKMGIHPKIMTERNIANFTKQLKKIGNMFDWDHTVDVMNPDYYRWTQWLFTQLFKAGLAYKKESSVTWCPGCKTTVSDEQTEQKDDQTVCERCKTPIERKQMKQWFFKITNYTQRLLDNAPKLDWPQKILSTQKNWIGKSEGATIKFQISNCKLQTEVFTTRPDTLHGCTYLVLAPEHQLVLKVTTENYKDKVVEYLSQTKRKTEQERKIGDRNKTGVFTGAYAINPVNNKRIPIWVADYVLLDYGEGAVMGVPAHDERDFDFAKKYKLPIEPVILKSSDKARSYLIGASQITNQELEKNGVSIIEDNSQGSRKLEIDKTKLESYKDLIREKLDNGFWNEIVGDRIEFIFKFKDGTVKDYILSDDNKSEINTLCAKLNKEEIGDRSPYSYIAENEWYKPLLIHHDNGILINSEDWNGWQYPQDFAKIMNWLEKRDIGCRKVTYKLRDWNISRQRYWGPPIPMIYCPKCAKEGKSWFDSIASLQSDNTDMAGWYPVPDDQLPVELPMIDDFLPDGSGKAPLTRHPEFLYVKCPVCGYQKAERETDVSDTFLDSSWYYLRYPSTIGGVVNTQTSKKQAFDPVLTKKWLPVTQYCGGAEHAVLHLMYSRFIWMVLSDLGYFNYSEKNTLIAGWEEPFPRLYAHGLLIKDGAKMSKSKGNVVNPDEYIAKYGADTLRLYLSFMGPYSEGGDFRDTGIAGMQRFIHRIWKNFHLWQGMSCDDQKSWDNLERKLHITIKKVTYGIEHFKYNTSIAALMELTNLLEKESINFTLAEKTEDTNLIKLLKIYNILLAPFAPHVSEYLWQLHNKTAKSLKSVHLQTWPKYNQDKTKQDDIIIAIQINGKLRGTIKLPVDETADRTELITNAKKAPGIAKYLDNNQIIREIVVPNRLVNFVVK